MGLRVVPGLRGWAMRCLPAFLVLLATSAEGAEDCNRNGIPDEEEVAAKGTDCNGNGIPDGCDVLPQSLDFASTSYSTGDSPRSPAAGDLDGDGDADVIIVNLGSDSISVFHNQGAGILAAPVDLTTGPEPLQAVLLDLDLDGDLDLLVSLYNLEEGGLSLFRNRGAGSFGGDAAIRWIGIASTVLAADLDGDGDLDLAGTAVSDKNGMDRRTDVGVLYNQGGGVFGEPRRFPAGLGSGKPGLAAVDFDGDGDLDLARALVLDSSHHLNLLANDGQGTFELTGDS